MQVFRGFQKFGIFLFKLSGSTAPTRTWSQQNETVEHFTRSKEIVGTKLSNLQSGE